MEEKPFLLFLFFYHHRSFLTFPFSESSTRRDPYPTIIPFGFSSYPHISDLADNLHLHYNRLRYIN